MATVRDEYEKFVSKCGDDGDKIIGFAIIGSNLNMLREGAEEIQDEDVLDAFDAIIELVEQKSNALFEEDV